MVKVGMKILLYIHYLLYRALSSSFGHWFRHHVSQQLHLNVHCLSSSVGQMDIRSLLQCSTVWSFDWADRVRIIYKRRVKIEQHLTEMLDLRLASVRP